MYGVVYCAQLSLFTLGCVGKTVGGGLSGARILFNSLIVDLLVLSSDSFSFGKSV